MTKSQTPPTGANTALPNAARQHNLTNLMKAIGPGLLVACAAVGGSHLVWSTRAGAEFGWQLVWLILLANFLKFPFFLYGQRYSAATGESLLAGYLRLGRPYLWTFLAINILTGTINIAGVAMLSGALLQGFGWMGTSVAHTTVLLLIGSTVFLLVGHYRLLDVTAKLVIAFLAISTLLAVVYAIPHRPDVPAEFVAPSPYTWVSFAFLIALLGWMPAPVDLSAWSSLWMFSREKQTGHFANTKESAIDFYIGYGAATLLAVVFLALGALVMFGSGESFSASGVAFSNQLVQLYTSSMGEAWGTLILTAAFITMFSTTLTCMDGYPRSLAASCLLLTNGSLEKMRVIQTSWMLLSVMGASAIVLFLVNNLLQMLAFAAVISFLTSPVLAYINLRVMQGTNVPENHRPGPLLTLISWLGLAFFAIMAAGYAYVTLLF